MPLLTMAVGLLVVSAARRTHLIHIRPHAGVSISSRSNFRVGLHRSVQGGLGGVDSGGRLRGLHPIRAMTVTGLGLLNDDVRSRISDLSLPIRASKRIVQIYGRESR